MAVPLNRRFRRVPTVRPFRESGGGRLGLLGRKPPRVPTKLPKYPKGIGQSVLSDIEGWAPGWEQHIGTRQNLPQVGPYNPLIGGDWETQMAEGTMAERMARARGDFTQQLRQALIDLGVTDVSKIGGLGQYIDADTIKKAAENKYSQTAQIAQRETARKASGEAALAARGILTSGQTAREAEQRVAEAESSRYDALRSFLSGGEQGLRGMADLEYSLAQDVARARFAAAQRAAEMYPYGEEGPAPAVTAINKGLVKMPKVKRKQPYIGGQHLYASARRAARPPAFPRRGGGKRRR